MKNRQKKHRKPKNSEIARALRQNQTCSKSNKINQELTEPHGEQNSSKQKLETKDRSQLILVCAFVVWMTIVVIERIFVKDDVLLHSILPMLSLIIGYYFGRSKIKEVA